MIKITRIDLIASAIAGVIYFIGFMIAGHVGYDILLSLFPSENEDDVRFDLFIPLILIMHASGLVFSYLALMLLAQFIRIKNILKVHLYYCFVLPPFLVLGYATFAALALLTNVMGDSAITALLVCFLVLFSSAAYLASTKLVSDYGN